MSDPSNHSSYQLVAEKLLQKTSEMRESWQETADPDTYIAAVRGRLTFPVPTDGENVRVRVLDRLGVETFAFDISGTDLGLRLVAAIRDSAGRLDGEIGETLQVLDSI